MKTLDYVKKLESNLGPGIALNTMRPATLADAAAVTALYNACAMEQLGKPEFEDGEVEREWQQPNFDLHESVRVVENEDGRIIAAVEVWDTRPVPVSNWVWGRVHPDYTGQGIGTCMLRWAEQCLQRAVERVPEGVRITMRSGSLSTHAPTKALLEGYGMELVRHFWRMVIELDEAPPAPVWPEGITLTTAAELDDLRAIYIASDDAFKDHWGHVEQPLDEGFQTWKHSMTGDDVFDPRHWLLAMDGSEIAAVSLCRRRSYDDPDMGWVNVLGVRRPWRRQGLGLALLLESFNMLHKLGKARVGLGVDAGSLTGATRLYEKAGMHVARQYDSYEKELRSGRDISVQELDA